MAGQDRKTCVMLGAMPTLQCISKGNRESTYRHTIEFSCLLLLFHGRQIDELCTHCKHHKDQSDQGGIGSVTLYGSENPKLVVIVLEGLSMNHRIHRVNGMEVSRKQSGRMLATDKGFMNVYRSK